MKHIAFIGTGSCDMVLYIGRILVCLGEKVLLCDRTVQKVLRDYIGLPEAAEDGNAPYDFKGMLYSCEHAQEENTEVSIELSVYDYVPYANLCDMTFFVGSEDSASISSMLKAARTRRTEYFDREPVYLVVRYYTGCTKRKIDELAAELSAERTYLLPWDKKDRKLELLAFLRDEFRFDGISDEFDELIRNTVTALLPDLQHGRFIKAYRKASKGGRI